MTRPRLPVRQIRERLALSLPDFGKVIGAHEHLVSEWERGQTKPTPQFEREIHTLIVKWFIANMLQVTWKDVFDHMVRNADSTARLFAELSEGRELPEGFRDWTTAKKIKWLDYNWPVKEGYKL